MGGPVRDPGLQPARTRLAWRRTTLSCTVAAVLAVKAALQSSGGRTLGLVAAALVLLVWLGFLAVAHRRITGLALNEAEPPLMTRRGAATAALCVVAMAVFAAALVV
ncbi:DUF202 domain-containing protein [Streptomyces sp. NPDC052225]|uniref:DUF202 domain-containing protein n=1 Tax=Streptomyces sp. NPDC052225 TaxID=3154949 RepID=UPI00343F908C